MSWVADEATYGECGNSVVPRNDDKPIKNGEEYRVRRNSAKAKSIWITQDTRVIRIGRAGISEASLFCTSEMLLLHNDLLLKQMLRGRDSRTGAITNTVLFVASERSVCVCVYDTY